MKLFKYLLVIIVILFGNNFANAQDKIISLENYSQIISPDRIPEKIILTVNKISYDLPRQEILNWISEKNELSYSPNYLSEIENIDFCVYKKSLFCRLTIPYKNQNHIKNIRVQKINQDLIAKFIQDLARKINQDPQDAKLTIENEKVSVFSLSKDGFKLDEEKSLAMINKYLSEEKYSEVIDLPFKIVPPEIATDSIENLGITSLIGEGHSNFKGSPKNRIFNINVATSRFDGILIKPGEEFSFVKILGEVDGEHGYLPELVIKFNKTEPEFGGGICQVSTTAFRAAINSGLKITARRNHAYPVSYYNPQGMDATVYVPQPDLRFMNDTPSHILVKTKIEGTQLSFYFYGKSDGRKINIIGPKITERKPDGSMKATFTQQIFDINEKLIREDVFNSAYASPNKYPHPGAETTLTEKPNGWSDKEWKDYKKTHNL